MAEEAIVSTFNWSENPRAGHTLGVEVLQDLLDRDRAFDGADDAHFAAASLASFDVYLADRLAADAGKQQA